MKIKNKFLFLIAFISLTSSLASADVRVTICSSNLEVMNNNLWFKAIDSNISFGTGGAGDPTLGGTPFSSLSDFTVYNNTLLIGSTYSGNPCSAAATNSGYKVWADINIKKSLTGNFDNLIIISGTNATETLTYASRLSQCFVGLKTGLYKLVDLSLSSQSFNCY